MTDNRDPLESLWLQQDVNVPDKTALRKRWKREKQKQFFYAFLDITSVFIVPLMIWMFYDRMSRYELWLLGTLSVITAGFGAYVVRLRRAALNFQSSTTEDFINLLKLQYRQNIKIARLSKLSIIPTIAFFVLFLTAMYLSGNYSDEQMSEKLFVTVMLIAVLCPVIWVWAFRRQRYFEHELDKLQETNSIQS